MSLIRQSVRGNFRQNDVVMSAGDLLTFQSLLEGKVTVFDEKSSGGTDIATPALLRSVRLGVNRKLDKLSCTVNIKHMKPAKHLTDLFAEKVLFDADFESALAATGMRCIYEGSK